MENEEITLFLDIGELEAICMGMGYWVKQVEKRALKNKESFSQIVHVDEFLEYVKKVNDGLNAAKKAYDKELSKQEGK